ncbi:hypothetical protein SDC9_194674 [bioreactor metagenome]|uniref:Uncharacterized protein n=1 Tax=bioreactor metagenome TaxID=1076179 RepID=A0A645IFK1_9ZZZZ
MVSPHNHIRRSLRGRVGAIRRKGRSFGKHAASAKSAVNLVGGHLQKLYAGSILLTIFIIRLGLPMIFGNIQQILRTDNIRC